MMMKIEGGIFFTFVCYYNFYHRKGLLLFQRLPRSILKWDINHFIFYLMAITFIYFCVCVWLKRKKADSLNFLSSDLGQAGRNFSCKTQTKQVLFSFFHFLFILIRLGPSPTFFSADSNWAGLLVINKI